DLKIRYRTGKTVVPLRISGNIKWGIPIPIKEDIENLTFWVWPESLWAPISFTKTYLKENHKDTKWNDWWKNNDSKIYQFIGEDNIYFYGIAEIGLFHTIDKHLNIPVIIPNHHLLYGNSKASSSGKNKPPTANELLNYYTPEQLRLHFMNMDLGKRSVKFSPKAALGESGFDDVLHEGNLLTNIFNRLVRSCFYTLQKYNFRTYPLGKVSTTVKEKSDNVILQYEYFMSNFSFNKVYELLNDYLREANKYWVTKSKDNDYNNILQLLIDSFHIVRVATTLFHPIAPSGCEMIREYLNIDDRIRNWDYIFETIDFFVDINHKFKFVPPRTDFFKKHSSQIKQKENKK
ncbi:MAG: class I tRNA ligase family protein, partial [Clostridiales bacterium]|nr:class I tRNA ligase family protein [Clostridiales bacterium]